VTLRDGRVLTSQVDMPLGRTSSNALPEALMKKKFELCTARVLNRGATEGIVDAIWRIADQTSIRALTGLIEAQTL
jgi:2-methylcitrate dehydratase PrpD